MCIWCVWGLILLLSCSLSLCILCIVRLHLCVHYYGPREILPDTDSCLAGWMVCDEISFELVDMVLPGNVPLPILLHKPRLCNKPTTLNYTTKTQTSLLCSCLLSFLFFSFFYISAPILACEIIIIITERPAHCNMQSVGSASVSKPKSSLVNQPHHIACACVSRRKTVWFTRLAGQEMALATPEPFANAASKAPRTLGCLPLKAEQTLVVFWSVGRDVLAVAIGNWLCAPQSSVLPAAFDYVNRGGPHQPCWVYRPTSPPQKTWLVHREVCVKLP